MQTTADHAAWPEPGPLVVVGRGHSGTRFLAEALQRQGIFIGTDLTPMLDSRTWERTIEDVVLGIYPAYNLLEDGDVWHRKIEATARRFLAEGHRGGPWGWKIGIGGFIIPALRGFFPGLHVVHVIRDGRDVMLSRLARVGNLPQSRFSRKIVLGDADIGRWWGHELTDGLVERHRDEFEMLAWVQFVTVARRYGRELPRDRYLEVRYEDLCRRPRETIRGVFGFAGLTMRDEVAAFVESNARTDRIGKWERLPADRIAPAVAIGRLLLEELGYLLPTAAQGPETSGHDRPRRFRSLARALRSLIQGSTRR